MQMGMTEQMGGKPVSGDLPYAFAEFSDIPIPEKANMILDHTSIYGRADEWVGKITYTVPYGVSGVYDFYISEMPRFGWDEITSIRGSAAAMTYIKGRRVAMIQINATSLDGTVVVFNMSPLPPKIKINSERDDTRVPRVRMDAGIPASQTAPAQYAPYTPAPSKQAAGGLGLGDASNAHYVSGSTSPGVGVPPSVFQVQQ
jgi:hypothetical protein